MGVCDPLSGGGLPMAVFRRGAQRVRIRTTGTATLPSNAADAQRELVALLGAEPSTALLAAGL